MLCAPSELGNVNPPSPSPRMSTAMRRDGRLPYLWSLRVHYAPAAVCAAAKVTA